MREDRGRPAGHRGAIGSARSLRSPRLAPRTRRGRCARCASPARASARRGPSRSRTSCARACAWSASPDPAILVLMGATGDLAHRKVLPALFQLWRTNLLPHEFVVLAVGRRPYDDESFRAEIRVSLQQYSRVQPIEEAAWQSFAERICYHRLDFADNDGFDGLAKRLDELDEERGTRGNRLFYLATQPSQFAELVGPARSRRARPRASRRRLAADRHREAVRPRPRVREAAEPRGREGLPRVAGLPHRPLPGQGDRPQPAGLPVRERDLRTALEPPLRRPRADHRGRVDRHREPGRVLRGDRGVARRPPEPPPAAGQPRRDGAAGHLRRRMRCATRRSRSCGRSRPIRPTPSANVVRGQYGPGWVAATKVPGYREEPDVDPRLRDRDVRGRQARHRRLALVRRPVLCPDRQAPAEARDRDRDPVPRGPAPTVPRRRGRPRSEPAGHPRPAGRGDHAALRGQGAGPGDGRPLGDHGLHLRLGVQRRLARRLRDAHPRRPPGRCLAVHPRRRGRGGVEHRRPADRRLGERTGAVAPELRRRDLGTAGGRRAARPRRAALAARSSRGDRYPGHGRRAGPALVGEGRQHRRDRGGAHAHVVERRPDRRGGRPAGPARRGADQRDEPGGRRSTARGRGALRRDDHGPDRAPSLADDDHRIRRPRRAVVARGVDRSELRAPPRGRARDVRRDDHGSLQAARPAAIWRRSPRR